MGRHVREDGEREPVPMVPAPERKPAPGRDHVAQHWATWLEARERAPEPEPTPSACPACHGSGRVGRIKRENLTYTGDPCEDCDGRGYTEALPETDVTPGPDGEPVHEPEPADVAEAAAFRAGARFALGEAMARCSQSGIPPELYRLAEDARTGRWPA